MILCFSLSLSCHRHHFPWRMMMNVILYHLELLIDSRHICCMCSAQQFRRTNQRQSSRSSRRTYRWPGCHPPDGVLARTSNPPSKWSCSLRQLGHMCWILQILLDNLQTQGHMELDWLLLFLLNNLQILGHMGWILLICLVFGFCVDIRWYLHSNPYLVSGKIR